MVTVLTELSSSYKEKNQLYCARALCNLACHHGSEKALVEGGGVAALMMIALVRGKPSPRATKHESIELNRINLYKSESSRVESSGIAKNRITWGQGEERCPSKFRYSCIHYIMWIRFRCKRFRMSCSAIRGTLDHTKAWNENGFSSLQEEGRAKLGGLPPKGLERPGIHELYPTLNRTANLFRNLYPGRYTAHFSIVSHL